MEFAAKLTDFKDLICENDNTRLKVFHSDPLDYHSIVDALKGCCGLFYSFAPPSDHPTYDVSTFLIQCLVYNPNTMQSVSIIIRVRSEIAVIYFSKERRRVVLE